MDQIQNFIQSLAPSLGPFALIIVIGVIGVMMIVFVIIFMVQNAKDPWNKLKDGSNSGTTFKRQSALRENNSKYIERLEKYSDYLTPQDNDEYAEIRLTLLQAGYRHKNSVLIYHFMQFALAVGFLLLGLLYAIFQSQTTEVTTQQGILWILLPALVGYILPKRIVSKKRKERETAIENAFPDSLDLMLVCVEAGQSLDQSLVRVANELVVTCPELAIEYALVNQELKAGKDRTSVLRDMADRVGLHDITSFVTVLVQSQQFGTSIAEALRVYASEMRDKRVMRAEEAANKLPTKMTLATMMLTVPPLMVILVGPAVYGISSIFSGGG